MLAKVRGLRVVAIIPVLDSRLTVRDAVSIPCVGGTG